MGRAGEASTSRTGAWSTSPRSRTISCGCRSGRRRSRPRRRGPWIPLELVKKRFPDARDPRVFVKQPGLAIVTFERVNCPAHIVLYQPLREWEGEKSHWDFAVIRSPEEPAYECLAEPPVSSNRPP